MRKPLPEDVLEYFRQQGAKGGKKGGKRRMETTTAKQRKEWATKASKAAAIARTAKAKARKRQA
jgi:hypothetical protein